MTPSDPSPPQRPDLTPGKLLLRAVLGLIVLAIGIYTLTRKATTTTPAPPPSQQQSPTMPDGTVAPPATHPATPSIDGPATTPTTSPAAYVPGDALIVGPTATPPPAAKIPAGDISAIAFGKDARLLVAQRGGIALHDLSSGSRVPLTIQLPAVREMRASPGGETIAIAAGDATPTIIWSVVPASAHKLAQGASVVCFSPDGRTLATGHQGGELRLWDAIAWNNTATLRVGVGPVQAIAFAPDGRSVAAGGAGVAIWELPGNRPRMKLGGNGACPSIAYSPDGHVLATAGDGGVVLWETVFWQKLATLAPGQAATRVAIWRSGTSIVMSLADGSIQLWDATTRQRTVSLPIRGPIIMFALSPDDRTLATASASAVTLWDTTTRNPRPLP